MSKKSSQKNPSSWQSAKVAVEQVFKPVTMATRDMTLAKVYNMELFRVCKFSGMSGPFLGAMSRKHKMLSQAAASGDLFLAEINRGACTVH